MTVGAFGFLARDLIIIGGRVRVADELWFAKSPDCFELSLRISLSQGGLESFVALKSERVSTHGL
jgi:hypothetical protein